MTFIIDNVSGPYRWSHSSAKAKSGNLTENGLLSFSVALFWYFFGQAKK